MTDPTLGTGDLVAIGGVMTAVVAGVKTAFLVIEQATIRRIARREAVDLVDEHERTCPGPRSVVAVRRDVP